MKKYSLYFVIIIFMGFFACKKTPDTIPDNRGLMEGDLIHNIDTVLSHNFLFNPGTYWIYLDSVNNITDSCYVISNVERSWIMDFPQSNPQQTFIRWEYPFAYDLVNQTSFQFNYFLQEDSLCLLQYSLHSAYDLCYTYNGALRSNNPFQFYSSFAMDTLLYSNVYKFSFHKPVDAAPGIADSGYFYLKEQFGILKSDLYKNGQKSTYKVIRYSIN